MANPDGKDAPLSRRERRKVEVRTRILEASVELFESQGIDGTKVQDICERADIAHKTFFNYFPSKKHLLREVAQFALDQLLTNIEDVCKRPLASRERIHLFFRNLADNADEAGPMHSELLTEIVHIAHESGTESEQARKLHDAFARLVSECQSRGDMTTAHAPETLTEMLMGAFYVLMFNWANFEGYALRKHAEATAEFLASSMISSDT